MRILYSHRVQSHDGQGVHIDELVRALRAAGHMVNTVGPSFYAKAGFGGSALVAAARRVLPAAAAEWAEIGYDHSAYRRLRRVCDLFKPDLIYERCNLFFTAGARVARSTGSLFFLEVNAPLAHERMQHGGLALAARGSRTELDVWRAADRVLTVTSVLADIVAAAGVARAQITVIPNGVDPARFPPRPPRATGQPVSLGFVGFMRPWHGLDLVIEGLAARTGGQAVTLTLVGDGPARPQLERLAARLGLADRVTFTGAVPPERVGSLLAGFDIALQPQATLYASPLKIFDYMAAGCAIVAPDQPNIREVLKHGQTAVLFDPEAPQLMWNAVQWLIEEPALRNRLGAAARAWIESENRTWAGNAARVVALAEEDLANRRALRQGSQRAIA
jgi:glycosyltransferase involved in cell wall biosynthesis